MTQPKAKFSKWWLNNIPNTFLDDTAQVFQIQPDKKISKQIVNFADAFEFAPTIANWVSLAGEGGRNNIQKKDI